MPRPSPSTLPAADDSAAEVLDVIPAIMDAVRHAMRHHVGEQLDRLVRAGAVEPRADPQDRRKSSLHLTQAGTAQLAAIRRGARKELAQVLATRSDEELRTLHAGLAVLRQVFIVPPTPP